MTRLLDRQADLLAYLTSSAAIFGDRDAPAYAGIAGIDRVALRLEARFSHQKRMEKIAAVFPRTLRLLGSRLDPIVREFVQVSPPSEIGRLANARQFHLFLTDHCGHAQSGPKYLLDVAACELACAEVGGADAPGPGTGEGQCSRPIGCDPPARDPPSSCHAAPALRL
jgi:hypothetical protein